MTQPTNAQGKLVDKSNNPQLQDRQAAITATPSITNYTAHASGATTVTSNAATDLDTTAAALATLENEVTSLAAVVTEIVDVLELHGLVADN